MKNYKWWQDNERYIPDPWDEIAKFEQELKTANEVLESLILHLRVEANHPCPENLVICRELQAAIDAARKEAQP